ncbi:MAG: ferredoxin-thioredoxin reductase catalytic domain-containing protein [Candidatus Pacearchaeota archaeon]
MDKSRINKEIKIWKEFALRQKNSPEKFKINPDSKRVELLANGVLNNENEFGFKFCPCRMTLGDLKEDTKLICPCNFKSQKTWREKGECWCSLFVKDKNN